MKISWNWINRNIDMNGINIEQYCQRLEDAGLKINKVYSISPEKTRTKKGNRIIDAELPEGRIDLAGMYWLSKDVCGLFRRPFVWYELCNHLQFIKSSGTIELQATWSQDSMPSVKYTDSDNPLKLEIVDQCVDYCMAAVINQIHQSDISLPDYMEDEIDVDLPEEHNPIQRLAFYNMKNLGHAVLLFDLNKLPEKNLYIQRASTDGELIYQGKITKYYKDDLVYASGGAVIALPNVLVDDHYCVDESSEAVVYSACTMPLNESVLERASTPQSEIVRYGTNPHTIKKAIYSFAAFAKYGQAEGFETPVTSFSVLPVKPSIKTCTEEINALTGQKLSLGQIRDCLWNNEFLTIRITDDKEDFEIYAPSYYNFRKIEDYAELIRVYTMK